MENVGIVILKDGFLKAAETQTQFEQMFWYKVAIHELCHMWFGDLVTIRWWDDLWLKESFADYCASVCMTECTDFTYMKNANMFMLQYLYLGISEDTMNTTHPISAKIPHTNAAVETFDHISYRKGAKVLH
jgi:aminopeptidase N